MKIVGIVVKALIAIAVLIKTGIGGDPGGAFVLFAMIYGLGTLYIWHFSTHNIFVGAGGPMSHVWALIVNLCIPPLIVVVPVLLLNMIPGVGTILSGIILFVLCLGCLFFDVLYIVRLFKPDFLAGVPEFPSKKKDDADGE